MWNGRVSSIRVFSLLENPRRVAMKRLFRACLYSKTVVLLGGNQSDTVTVSPIRRAGSWKSAGSHRSLSDFALQARVSHFYFGLRKRDPYFEYNPAAVGAIHRIGAAAVELGNQAHDIQTQPEVRLSAGRVPAHRYQ